MNFADCVVRLSQGKGKYMREFWNPTKDGVCEFLSMQGFPRYRGPMSKAEYQSIVESIKNVKILSQPPKDLFTKNII